MKKHPLRHLLIAVLPVAALLAASGCTPTVDTRGNMVSETKISRITPAVSSRADVESYWGPPTTVAPFDPNIWYYIGETTEQKGIFAPEVEKRQIVRVTFDQGDIVSQIAALDPKNGQEIAFIDRKTPTAGKEFTMFQQFIGNLGKFNSATNKK